MVDHRHRRRPVQARARVRTLTLIVDTSVFVAARDTDEEHHEECAALIAGNLRNMITTALIAGETGWMLASRIEPAAEAFFYRTLSTGAVKVHDLNAADWARIAELTEKYGDHPLGGFDASLIAIAERLNLGTIATLDHRHFRAVRPKHVEAFTLVP